MAKSIQEQEPQLSMIVAATQMGGIGADGNLAWNLPSDMKFFRKTTTSFKRGAGINKVIMGKFYSLF